MLTCKIDKGSLEELHMTEEEVKTLLQCDKPPKIVYDKDKGVWVCNKHTFEKLERYIWQKHLLESIDKNLQKTVLDIQNCIYQKKKGEKS